MEVNSLIGYSAIISGLIVGSISLQISLRYKKFRLPFIFLAISFFSYAVAELGYYLLDLHGLEPYQTALDIAYGGYFIFALIHIISTLKQLRGRKFLLEHLIIILVVFSSLTSLYVVTSLTNETDLDTFLYGGIFVTMASGLAAFSMIMIIKCIHTILMRTWLFIGVSILVSSITDVWYYTQENLTGYEYGEFPLIDILYFVTDIMMIMGIIYHWKKI